MSSKYYSSSSSSSSSTSSSGRSTPENYDEKTSSEISSSKLVQPTKNVFANDGSFLEMFKKYQEKQKQSEDKQEEKNKSAENKEVKEPENSQSVATTSTQCASKVPMLIGKRRGGKILPIGRVKKVKKDDEDDTDYDAIKKPKDAWSIYMSEVKKYKESVCQSDDISQPLVK